MRDFADLVRAEWTKLRTVRGWVWWLVGGVLLTVVVTMVKAALWWTDWARPGALDYSPVTVREIGWTSDVLELMPLMLVWVMVVAVLHATSEYRHGLIRTTFTVSPHRVPVVLAKGVVVAVTTFVAVTTASVSVWPATLLLKRALGYSVSFVVLPDPTDTTVILVTAVAASLLAVIATCLGMVWRRTAGPITVLVVALVLPYAAVVPSGPVDLGTYGKVTPLAGFQVQGGWAYDIWHWSAASAGLGVLVLWTVGALAVTAVVLHRRDEAPELEAKSGTRKKKLVIIITVVAVVLAVVAAVWYFWLTTNSQPSVDFDSACGLRAARTV